jgi:hypothetical protein
MARESEISYESVAVECIELWARGQITSFENVHEKLGRRAPPALVQQFVEQWQQENADRLVAKHAHLDLPVELVAASDALLRQTWQMALVNAETQLKRQGERPQNEAALALCTERAHFAESEFLRLSAETHGLRAELRASDEALATTTRRLDEVSAALARREDQLVKLRDDLAQALQGKR